MTPAEHYNDALRCLDNADKCRRGHSMRDDAAEGARYYVLRAQVHATLALFPQETTEDGR
jgi:hypothetical protein